jgi:hypothetical protein
MLDLAVRNLTALYRDSIEVSFGSETAIHMGIGEAGVSTEEPHNTTVSITSNNALQNTMPIIGTVDIGVRSDLSALGPPIPAIPAVAVRLAFHETDLHPTEPSHATIACASVAR